MSAPLVSVVIPTRNRLPLLREAVDSVLRQSLEKWELVVVDDASTDGTWNWLRSLDDERIRPLRLARPSEQSTTRNTGVRAARSSVIVSLDDDDLLARDALLHHLRALDRYPSAIASVGGYVVFDGRGSRRAHRLVRRKQLREVWHDVLFGWVATAGQTAFRADALRAVDLWDERWTRVTDHELWSRIAHLGPVALLPEIVLHYRVHSGQWRPENLDQLMTRARERGVAQAPPELRAAGREMLELRARAITAAEHFLSARAASALRLYLATVRDRPRLLLSPLTRPLILPPMMKCLVGSWGIRVGRRLLDRLERIRGRAVDFSVRRAQPPEPSSTRPMPEADDEHESR